MKRLVLLAVLAVTPAQVQAQTPAPPAEMEIVLTAKDLSTIGIVLAGDKYAETSPMVSLKLKAAPQTIMMFLQALSTEKYRDVADLMQRIGRQVQAQQPQAPQSQAPPQQ